MALRYGWLPLNAPTNCACVTHFTTEHALSCPKGSFPSIRHNEVHDPVRQLAVWNLWQCLHWAYFTIHYRWNLHRCLRNNWRWCQTGHCSKWFLGIALNGCMYFDVRIFNPHAPSNGQQSFASPTWNMREQRSEPTNNRFESGSFTPLSCPSLVDVQMQFNEHHIQASCHNACWEMGATLLQRTSMDEM